MSTLVKGGSIHAHAVSRKRRISSVNNIIPAHTKSSLTSKLQRAMVVASAVKVDGVMHCIRSDGSGFVPFSLENATFRTAENKNLNGEHQ